MKIFKKTLLLFTFIFLFPVSIYAADLNITCFQNQKPLITTSTTPLFQISNFLPGDTVTRSVEINNTDNVNPCTISVQGDGKANTLTDNIEFSILNLYSKSLSNFIDGDDVTIAKLQPNQSTTTSITLSFPVTADNSLTNQASTFDIKINSQWGDEQGDVLGNNTDILNIEKRNETDFNPPEEDQNGTDVLGTAENTNNLCEEKTLWWVPLIIQIVITLLILPSKKLYLENIFVKIFITITLGVSAFLITKEIGCGCQILMLCKYSWILNILFGLSPIPLAIRKFT